MAGTYCCRCGCVDQQRWLVKTWFHSECGQQGRGLEIHVWGRLTGSAWWRQVETLSALLALWEGNPPVTGGFPWQRPVTRRFDIFFNLRLNKRLSKQSRRRWFEMQSWSLLRHYNGPFSRQMGKKQCTNIGSRSFFPSPIYTCVWWIGSSFIRFLSCVAINTNHGLIVTVL